jgi:3-dehydroquinate dehydratase/shikimate dehydrogenase
MSETSNRVCAVVAEKSTGAAREALRRAARVADLAELRLDYLRDFDFTSLDALRALVEQKPLPTIITCRALAEGGKQQVGDRVRLRLLVEGARRFADYCDIEAAHYGEAASLSPDPSRLIVSYHNFSETPADLNSIYDRITSMAAAVHKIVTRANNVADTTAIFKLLDRARTDGRQLIALAMGQPGLTTRVLGPVWGSFLTYGALEPGKESAAGQPSCDELINLYRVHRISRHTAITGIIGSPIGHSASPAMHNHAFARLDLDFVYIPFEAKDVLDFFRRFVRLDTREIDWNLRGLSVTIPHKSAVIRLLDEVDETARKIGAVNTVVVNDGRLIGYNTDVQGAMEPLEKACALADENCAVIGAGGSARALIHGLIKRGARVIAFARNPAKARELSETFGVPVLPIESLASTDAGVLINTTPVGMRGHSEGLSAAPRAALRGRRIVYDLVYNPIDTQLLIDARAEGCRTISGLEMLIAQAALQFELWTGHKPPTGAMRDAALDGIARRTE